MSTVSNYQIPDRLPRRGRLSERIFVTTATRGHREKLLSPGVSAVKDFLANLQIRDKADAKK